jgi:uncharacterized protein with PIN domain
MARLYANENFFYPVVEELRRLGHDVLTTKESGLADQRTSDEKILSFAVYENRIILTFNRQHFVRLHKEDSNHCGIIACSVDRDFSALAKRIHAAIGPC